jgi:hypothetical protein
MKGTVLCRLVPFSNSGMQSIRMLHPSQHSPQFHFLSSITSAQQPPLPYHLSRTMASVQALDYALTHGLPDPLPRLSADPTPEELATHQLHEKYQRTILHGFTITELDNAGCWGLKYAKVCTFDAGNQPIHPMFAPKLWSPKGEPYVDYLSIGEEGMGWDEWR